MATVYQFRNHPNWRWTHGYVENVAEAIVIAALHPAAAGRIYNVGEKYTPTIAERLAQLPPCRGHMESNLQANFDQNVAYDTTRIRQELGYREAVPEREGVSRTLSSLAA